MRTEKEFIHDLVNKISMAYGKVDRVLMKKDTFTHEEIVSNLENARNDLDETFELINSRKLAINGGTIIK